MMGAGVPESSELAVREVPRTHRVTFRLQTPIIGYKSGYKPIAENKVPMYNMTLVLT
jgi:hypothetical protein